MPTTATPPRWPRPSARTARRCSWSRASARAAWCPRRPATSRRPRAACDEAGALLVLDEIQSGIGRTGEWFAHQREGVAARRADAGQGARRRPADRRLHRPRRVRLRRSPRATTAAPSAATRSPAPPRSRCWTRSSATGCWPASTEVGAQLTAGIEAIGHPLVTGVRGSGLWLAHRARRAGRGRGGGRGAQRRVPGQRRPAGRDPAGAAADPDRAGGRRRSSRRCRRCSTPPACSPARRHSRGRIRRRGPALPARRRPVARRAGRRCSTWPRGSRRTGSGSSRWPGRAPSPCCSTSRRCAPGCRSRPASPSWAATRWSSTARAPTPAAASRSGTLARVLSSQVAAIVWRTFGQDRIEARRGQLGAGDQRADRRVPPVPGARRPADDAASVRAGSAGLTLTFLGDGASATWRTPTCSAAPPRACTCGSAARGSTRRPRPWPQAARAIAARTGGSVAVGADPDEACKGADVLATDVWTSMGQEGQEQAREAAMTPFRLDEAKLALASPGCRVLHCLPAHRGQEITAAVLDGPASLAWDQAENRLHAQKALLSWLHRRPARWTARTAPLDQGRQARPDRQHPGQRRRPGPLPGRADRAAGQRRRARSPRRRCPATWTSSARSGCAAPTAAGVRAAGRAPAGRRAGASPAARLTRVAARAASVDRRGQRQPGRAAHPGRAPRSCSRRPSTTPAGPSVLGTVGGDDTVLVIARDPAGGEELAQALLRLAERRSHAGIRPAGRRPGRGRCTRPRHLTFSCRNCPEEQHCDGQGRARLLRRAGHVGGDRLDRRGRPAPRSSRSRWTSARAARTWRPSGERALACGAVERRGSGRPRRVRRGVLHARAAGKRALHGHATRWCRRCPGR